MGEKPKALRHADPDLLRRLLQVHEDLQVLISHTEATPPGTGEPIGGFSACPALYECAQTVAGLVQVLEPELAALRKAYDQLVAFNADWQVEAPQIESLPVGRDDTPEAAAARVAEWKARIQARLERSLAGLRELVLLVAASARPPGGPPHSRS